MMHIWMMTDYRCISMRQLDRETDCLPSTRRTTALQTLYTYSTRRTAWYSHLADCRKWNRNRMCRREWHLHSEPKWELCNRSKKGANRLDSTRGGNGRVWQRNCCGRALCRLYSTRLTRSSRSITWRIRCFEECLEADRQSRWKQNRPSEFLWPNHSKTECNTTSSWVLKVTLFAKSLTKYNWFLHRPREHFRRVKKSMGVGRKEFLTIVLPRSVLHIHIIMMYCKYSFVF